MDIAALRGTAGAMNTRDKIVTVAMLAERLKHSAKPDEKIVLAAGSFDLLSQEMVEQLQAARKDNVVLVVAVKPDCAPDCLLPAEARAQLVAGLASVDFVIVGKSAEVQAALQPPLKLETTIEVKSDLAPRLLARYGGHARA
jgi:bifunctional ADP-heptose synthase (sugar kinase/adenylyltransferase)